MAKGLESLMPQVMVCMTSHGKPQRFSEIVEAVRRTLHETTHDKTHFDRRVDRACQRLRKAGRIECVKQHWQLTANEKREQRSDAAMDEAAAAVGAEVFRRDV